MSADNHHADSLWLLGIFWPLVLKCFVKVTLSQKFGGSSVVMNVIMNR